jgi:mitogen-activated protein kinase kinase
MGARNHGTPDPVSAVGSIYSNASEGGADMARDGSLQGLEGGFDKLTLERALSQDVEELNEEGWRIASLEKRVIELGSLGEGAGGAVTKCKLRGGKTIFALKVRHPARPRERSWLTLLRSSQQTQTTMSRGKLSAS